jgi:D-alanine-D-alanine ligase
MKALQVAVIMGGSSFERDFSLKSGRHVVAALEAAGHTALPLDADENLVDTLRAMNPDVAFIAMHGKGGEDGAVGSLLEFLGIPYVGSQPPVCRTTWNKPDLPFVMRRAFSEDASVARWPSEVALPASAFRDLGAASALDLVAPSVGAGFPLAVKPARGGSALGLTKVASEGELGDALMAAFAFDDEVLIQDWIEGVELSIAVIGEPGDEQVLPPVEIVPLAGVFDTAARLETELVDYYCPVRPQAFSSDEATAASMRSECERAAIEVYRAFACRDMARIDLVWDGACARVLDVKVFPGLTETSLVPMAVAAAGINFSDLISELVLTAYERGV